MCKFFQTHFHDELFVLWWLVFCFHLSDEFLISDQEDQEACKQEGSRSIGSSSDTNENKGKDDLDEKVLTPPDFWHIQVTPPFL